MKKVIFICRRNRFRSQIAEALYNNMAKDGSYAESYGTKVLLEEEGVLFESFPKVANTIEAMKTHNIDIKKAYPKSLTTERINKGDKIIVLTDKKDIPEWLNEYPHESWEVIDYPGRPTLMESEETINLLKLKISNLLKTS